MKSSEVLMHRVMLMGKRYAYEGRTWVKIVSPYHELEVVS